MIRKKEAVTTIIVVLITVVAVLAYFNNGAGTLEIKVKEPQNLDEATRVCLNYTAIEIHQAKADYRSGWVKVIDKSDWINLTSATDVNRTIVYANLQAGTYNMIRLRFWDARITVDGTSHNASVPVRELVTPIPNEIKLNTGQTATLMMEINVTVKGQNSTNSTKMSSESESVTLIPQVTVTQP